MSTKTLASMKKYNQCVCHMTGILSAELVRGEDNSKSIKAVLCDQHPAKFAAKSIEHLKATGLEVSTVNGKAREPVEEV